MAILMIVLTPEGLLFVCCFALLALRREKSSHRGDIFRHSQRRRSLCVSFTFIEEDIRDVICQASASAAACTYGRARPQPHS